VKDPVGFAGVVPGSELPPCDGRPFAHCTSEGVEEHVEGYLVGTANAGEQLEQDLEAAARDSEDYERASMALLLQSGLSEEETRGLAGLVIPSTQNDVVVVAEAPPSDDGFVLGILAGEGYDVGPTTTAERRDMRITYAAQTLAEFVLFRGVRKGKTLQPRLNARPGLRLNLVRNEVPSVAGPYPRKVVDGRVYEIRPSRSASGVSLFRVNRWPDQPSLHGNSLSASGPHQVYALLHPETSAVLRFGETGRGAGVRLEEWRRIFARDHNLEGIDIRILRNVEGKAAARSAERRFIEAYEKVFGEKPPYQKTYN
jgi:hypothetical protein